MNTPVLPVDSQQPEPERIAQAAKVLRVGGLVAFPTETVYGLGASALDAAAVARVFTAKGRPAVNPVIVHVGDASAARRVVAAWPETADRLAGRFWPGPLTLVLPRCPAVPDVVTAGGPTVAVRVPAHPVALALLRAANVPVAAPSANRSGRLSPTRAAHVRADLDGLLDLILDGGACPGGIESTVLDLTTNPPRLLRPGLVTPADLEAIIGPVTLSHVTTDAAIALPSPGMLARHYSPRTPLECVEGGGRSRAEKLTSDGWRVGWLALGAVAHLSGAVVRRMPDDPTGYAGELYAALHELDALGLDRFVADLPPDVPEWHAVRDRLRRAATPG